MTDDIRKFHNVISGNSNQIYDYEPNISEVGDYKKINGIQVLIHSIRNLLLTPLGFYPFDPNYGSLLYKKVFEHIDADIIDEIKYEVTTRIKNFDKRIKISKVDIKVIGNDEKGVEVNVYVSKGELEGIASLTFADADITNQLNYL